MWKLMGTPRTQNVTKKLAQEFATMDPAPHDRPLRESRMLVYERLLREGKFRPITWASAFCKETGGTYRVNGKHTSTMLSMWDEKVDLFITVERYECETLDDVGRLYATFDSKMQSRTASDIYVSFAGCVPSLAEIQHRTLVLAVTAMNLVIVGGDSLKDKGSQPADRAELLLDNAPFVVWLQELVGKGSTIANIHLKRGAVVAAVFATYQRDSREALKFWTEVRDETAPKPDFPTRKLAKYLIMNFSRTKKSPRQVGARISDREIYVKAIHAWNAWRKNEATNLAYVATAPLPKP
jgi:hypothetical protein